MNKYFTVTYEKEEVDTQKLVDMIKQDGWISPTTIIVNCSPDYSSRLSQAVNHKLSHLNKNELYEQIPLEMPYPNMNQIYNPQTHEYELYDRYLMDWVRAHVDNNYQYLFIDSATIRGKNFSKLKSVVKSHVDEINYRFASLYVEKNSLFHPDYCVETYDSTSQGGILFQWENMNNPNWNY